jgi:hypothetical protein
LEEDSLIMLLISGQSLSVAANTIIQRNSGTTLRSDTYVPRPDLAEAMEVIAHLIRRDSSGTAATMIPHQRRGRHSLCPPNEETRSQHIFASLSGDCQLADSDVESDDRRDPYGTAATMIPQRGDIHTLNPLSDEARHQHLFAVLSEACLLGDSDDESDDL